MPEGYTYTLVSTIGLLAAVDLPIPVELSALAMVGLVLRWALIRQNRAHDEHDERLTVIETELRETREAKDIERQLKHAWKNEVTAMRATLAVMLPQAKRCTCATMEPLIPVLEKLALDTKEPRPT